MKVGDLVIHTEGGVLGLIIEDDSKDEDGLYLCWWGQVGWPVQWVDKYDVDVIN